MEGSTDYLVLGWSAAGVGAALELAALGRTVYQVMGFADGAGPEDSFLIGPTPLNPAPIRGTAFAELVREEFHQAGVRTWSSVGWFGSWDRASIDPDGGELVLEDTYNGEQQRFRAVIFAPAGSEPGLGEERERPFRGRGLSYSAWSDAPFFRGKPVAVAGCGRRALDQALIAAEHASSVCILCDRDPQPDFGILEEALRAEPRITLESGTRILALEGDAQGALARVVTEQHGERVSRDASGLFVAHDPVVDWSNWGGEAEAGALREQGKLFYAGLAAGVGYEDHAELFASGVRAARQCLAETGGLPR